MAGAVRGQHGRGGKGCLVQHASTGKMLGVRKLLVLGAYREQVLLRVATFIMNGFVLRFIHADLLGVVNMR